VPSLSDKLRALGAKVEPSGPERSSPVPTPQTFSALDQALGGAARRTPLGETYVVDARYPRGAPHGRARLALEARREALARWAGYPQLADLDAEAFAFLDTETTGLSGGTGTYAFLIGVARFEGDEFHLAQFFLRDPVEEPAQLGALEEFLAPCQALVTFNGKAFDAPLLVTRYASHGWKNPLSELMHVDLLHLARRLWRDRLPSRTLGNLEASILGARRTEEDVPGWMVPDLYFQYLRSGDPATLRGVFYHNAIDVLSMAALMDHMSGVLSDPVGQGGQHGVDLVALARLYEDLGDTTTAAQLYVYGLDHEDARQDRMPPSTLLQALERLALIHKRRSEWEAAIHLWKEAASRRRTEAYVELAKCYEHNLKDNAAALEWTQAAIQLIESTPTFPNDGPSIGLYERRQWLEQLERRAQRLIRKLAGGSATSEEHHGS
jgi:uncharacterized protein YprB with RNaseH-like and TPR domain